MLKKLRQKIKKKKNQKINKKINFLKTKFNVKIVIEFLHLNNINIMMKQSVNKLKQ